jgi:hypothetical protein
VNDNILAFYMGYTFSQAVNIQHKLAAKELMVPFVIYWQGNHLDLATYPAATQAEAVEQAMRARTERAAGTTGWSSSREGLMAQNDGSKLDTLLIEGWVPGLSSPLEMFVYCRKDPFRLLQGFFWKSHPEARKEPQSFMGEFKRGILIHPFGQGCLGYVDHADPAQVTAG